MSRFLKKRVPAFLITLVMVTTLIPMASAKSSADIEYEVDAGDNVTLEFSDFQNYYDKYESDNLYRMEFTDLTDVDSNGRMYAVDFEGDEVRVNEDDLYNSWFYASKSDVEDSGEYRIKGMNYSAGSKADGETAAFADADTVPAWARPGVLAMISGGIFRTTDGKIGADAKVTRADSAVWLCRIADTL